MVAIHNPFYLFSDVRRRLSNWWSDCHFAGQIEQPLRKSFFTSWLPILLLLLLSGLLFYSRLSCPLLEPEEARYAEISRQMLSEGHWLTPVAYGEDYLQKPPLLYWLIMICYRIFGVHDWAARLVPTTACIFIVLITYGWARWTVGPRAAWASGLILCLAPQFLYLGGMVAMDSLLCLWVIGGLACGHLALTPGKPDGTWTFWWLLSALCCGLGIMTKGPVAAVLILGPLTLWTLLEKRWSQLSLSKWLSYLAVVLLVAGPWYVLTSLRDPQATRTFFWLHNIVRYLAPFDHEKPSWFYLPSLLIGMLPWTFLLIPLVPYLTKKSYRWALRRPAGLGLFLIAFIWCLAFFSFSGCKRPGYILPALPPLAMVLGTCLTRALSTNFVSRPFFVAGSCTLAILLLAAGVFLLPEYHRKFGLRGQIRPHMGLARDIAVICYPRRWDSVSFYLEKEAAYFSPEERGQLIARLREGDALLFVKNGSAFVGLIQDLPPYLEFMPLGLQGGNVRVGLVKQKLMRAGWR